MSYSKKKSQRSSGKLLPSEVVHEGVAGSDLPKDQVILPPEIMNLILKNVDIRSLKQVRLVCKRWLREAHTQLETRGIIRFDRYTSTERIREFEDLRRRKVRALPQPFHFVDLDLDMDKYTLKRLMKQVFSNNFPPLALARFSTKSFDVDQAVRLIIEHSASLEYLKLKRDTFNKAHTLPKKQKFPKLRHLEVKDNSKVNPDEIYSGIDFPSFVARIVKGSPNLETFKSAIKDEPEGRELLRTVDIRNIKTLNLDYEDPKQSLIDFFLAIPFGQLQNLKLEQSIDETSFTRSPLEIVKTCSATLKVLDLTYADIPGHMSEFPVCPNVQELLLFTFPERLNILLQCFPSLEVLNVISIHVDVEDDLWIEQPPFPGLKTLRVLRNDLSDQSKEFFLKFFEKMPRLECVSLNVSALLRYCTFKARRKYEFRKILQGLKHLEIQGPFAKDFYDSDDDGVEGNDDATDDTDHDFSSLATLKGVEMITLLESNEALMRIPVRKLPSLKILRFPWGTHHSMDKLLALARRMEKVVITNCCSSPRVGRNPWSNEALSSLFESAPNVVCGCKG